MSARGAEVADLVEAAYAVGADVGDPPARVSSGWLGRAWGKVKSAAAAIRDTATEALSSGVAAVVEFVVGKVSARVADHLEEVALDAANPAEALLAELHAPRATARAVEEEIDLDALDEAAREANFARGLIELAERWAPPTAEERAAAAVAEAAAEVAEAAAEPDFDYDIDPEDVPGDYHETAWFDVNPDAPRKMPARAEILEGFPYANATVFTVEFRLQMYTEDGLITTDWTVSAEVGTDEDGQKDPYAERVVIRWTLGAKGSAERGAFWKRFASLWRGLVLGQSWDEVSRVQFRFVPDLAAWAQRAARQARVRDAPVGNCAIILLAARFPSREAELVKIPLTDGAFGREEGLCASRILCRNVRLLDRMGGTVWEACGNPKSEDGKYAGRGWVNIADVDGHALNPEDVPRRPSEGLELRLMDRDEGGRSLLWQIWEHYPLAQIWPAAEGFIVLPPLAPSAADEGVAILVKGGDKRKPLLVRDRQTYEAVRQRGRELGFEPADYQLKGSPFGAECDWWRRHNGFEKVDERLAGIWWAANHFPKPYCCGASPGRTADLNRAYESSPLVSERELCEQYGFPTAEGQVVANPSHDLLARTGCVLAEITLSDRCHPWIWHLLWAEERRKEQAKDGQWKNKDERVRGVFTTMRIKFWIDEGKVPIDAIALELAVITAKVTPDLARPPGTQWGRPEGGKADRAWGREAIGRLIPSGLGGDGVDEIIVREDGEAGSIIGNALRDGTFISHTHEKGALPRQTTLGDSELEELLGFELPTLAPKWGDDEIAALLADLADSAPLAPRPDPKPAVEVVGGFHRIRVTQKKRPLGSPHVHAYWLDYTAIAVEREVFAHEWSDIVKVKTDSITLAAGRAFSERVVFGVEPGQWKDEAFRRIEYSRGRPLLTPSFDDVRALAGQFWEPLCRDEPITVIEGPPGFGKTTLCLKMLENRPFVALTPTHRLKDGLRAKGVPALTWQFALRPRGKFDPNAVRVRRGQTVYIAEIGSWSREEAELILTWLVKEHGCRVVADGDRRQMPPFQGVGPWSWLDASPLARVDWFAEKDWRSKEPELAEFKMDLRALTTNWDVMQVIIGRVGDTPYGDFLAAWHPRDFVYVTTHAMRARIHKDLVRVHIQSPALAKCPVRVRYGESTGSKNGIEDLIPLGAAIPAGADLAYTTTYSACQGETASPVDGVSPRVWLVNHRLSEYFVNAAYVAATRVEFISQLGVITYGLPGGPMAP